MRNFKLKVENFILLLLVVFSFNTHAQRMQTIEDREKIKKGRIKTVTAYRYNQKTTEYPAVQKILSEEYDLNGVITKSLEFFGGGYPPETFPSTNKITLYNKDGKAISEKDITLKNSLESEEKYCYNLHGQLKEIVFNCNIFSQVNQYSYNNKGHMIKDASFDLHKKGEPYCDEFGEIAGYYKKDTLISQGYQEMIYDEKENCIKRIVYWVNTNEVDTSFYKYNKRGMLLEEEDGFLKGKTHYIYEKNDSLVKEKLAYRAGGSLSYIETWKYDKNENCIEHQYCYINEVKSEKGGFKIIIKYNNNNKLLQETKYDIYNEGSSINNISIYIYDKKGNLAWKFYHTNEGIPFRIYKYNKKGFLLNEYNFDYGNVLLSRTQYIYEYYKTPSPEISVIYFKSTYSIGFLFFLIKLFNTLYFVIIS